MSGNIMYTKDTWNILMNGMTIFWIPRKNFTRVGWKGIWVHIIKVFEIYRSVVSMVSMVVSKTSGEGSSPSTPAWDWSVAQLVEHQILVLRVVGSNPAISTNTDLVKGITSYTLMFVNRSSKVNLRWAWLSGRDNARRQVHSLIKTTNSQYICRVGRTVRRWSAKPVKLVQLQYPTPNHKIRTRFETKMTHRYVYRCEGVSLVGIKHILWLYASVV